MARWLQTAVWQCRKEEKESRKSLLSFELELKNMKKWIEIE